MCLMAEGHLLIEDVPGVGKTSLAKAIAASLGCSWRRIQFTPDLLPSDVTGVRAFNQKSNEFEFRPGPVFAQVLLADEINRATPKTQAALLEAMEEHQVTIDGETHALPRPFLVMATQNPIETEGTYPLPEAQVDRFMMKVLVGYPSEEEEFVIVNRVTGAGAAVAAVASTDELLALQRRCRTGYVDPSLVQYAVRLVSATRKPERFGVPKVAQYLTYGASPRATIHLVEGARALAFLRGRSYVLPEDLTDIAPDVLRHRLVLSYEALSDALTPDQLILRIMKHLPAPERPLETHVRVGANA
jgi:MoxR-like ATPase